MSLNHLIGYSLDPLWTRSIGNIYFYYQSIIVCVSRSFLSSLTTAYFEMADESESLKHIDEHLQVLLEKREYPKTICPSEVARALSSEQLQGMGAESWRDMMPTIRDYVFNLRDKGDVEILQKGSVLPQSQTLEDTTGPIRVRKVQ